MAPGARAQSPNRPGARLGTPARSPNRSSAPRRRAEQSDRPRRRSGCLLVSDCSSQITTGDVAAQYRREQSVAAAGYLSSSSKPPTRSATCWLSPAQVKRPPRPGLWREQGTRSSSRVSSCVGWHAGSRHDPPYSVPFPGRISSRVCVHRSADLACDESTDHYVRLRRKPRGACCHAARGRRPCCGVVCDRAAQRRDCPPCQRVGLAITSMGLQATFRFSGRFVSGVGGRDDEGREHRVGMTRFALTQRWAGEMRPAGRRAPRSAVGLGGRFGITPSRGIQSSSRTGTPGRSSSSYRGSCRSSRSCRSRSCPSTTIQAGR